MIGLASYVLVCNAVVYQPTANMSSFTAEAFELIVGINSKILVFMRSYMISKIEV